MENPQNILTRMIRKEFDSYIHYWQHQERENLINVAESYELFDLAEELKNDL